MANYGFPNTLRDVSKIAKLINRTDVVLMDDRNGTMYDKNEISHFAIIYDPIYDGYPKTKARAPKNSELKDVDEVLDDETDLKQDSPEFINKIITRELHIMTNGMPNDDHHGWYVVPIYEYQTEFRPIRVDNVNNAEDEIYLMIVDEPLFTLNESLFKSENRKEWDHTSFYILNKKLSSNSMPESGRFSVKSIIHHNRNLHNINALATALKSYNNAKAIRIKISNNIRSNFYVTIGRKMYNTLRQELADEMNKAAEESGKTLKKPFTPDDIVIFDYIEKEYDSLEFIMKKKVLTDDIRLICNRVINTKKKADREEVNFIEDMTKYLFNMIEKKNNISINNETEFNVIKKDLNLRFIPTLALYHQIKEYKKYKEIEASSEKYMVELVHKHPYWNRYLVSLCGTAEIIAAELIVGLNPLMARHPSSFHRYVGMDQVIATPDEKRPITKELQIMCITNLVENYFISIRNAMVDDVIIDRFNFDTYRGNFLGYKYFKIAKEIVKKFNYINDNIRNGSITKLIMEDFDKIQNNKEWLDAISEVLEKTDYHIQTATNGIEYVRIRKRARNKSDVVTSTYTDKNGQVKAKTGYGYNAKLKGKIVGVWSANILRKGGKDPKTGEYRSIYCKRYYDARVRYENRPDLKHQLEMANQGVKGFYKPNFHVMARRVTCQQFLTDLWFAERAIDGLPTNGGTYAEDKLGIIHLQERPAVLSVPCYTKEEYEEYRKSMT